MYNERERDDEMQPAIIHDPPRSIHREGSRSQASFLVKSKEWGESCCCVRTKREEASEVTPTHTERGLVENIDDKKRVQYGGAKGTQKESELNPDEKMMERGYRKRFSFIDRFVFYPSFPPYDNDDIQFLSVLSLFPAQL
ncbi:hypothetical protein GWI33_019144 [Rhynchophorus ferrugineus]|uniref:Uncharacterized protein n=1 Tax=Rhynchophorus ferrugineus TaxID=354439 RepID=A0A834HYS3_RHYFE|nr:hypothetical protein GWI33_019144 [Rhynchophorus ferrugineus]